MDFFPPMILNWCFLFRLRFCDVFLFLAPPHGSQFLTADKGRRFL